MFDSVDIGRILQHWPFHPQTINARLVQTDEGREAIQMRVDLGVLQMETIGRPDGEHPEGEETYLDHLIRQADLAEPEFLLDEKQCQEVDRELTQFYHRRICWMSLQNHGRAVVDADHSLSLLDFLLAHAPDEPWVSEYATSRRLVLFQRTQALAFCLIESDGPEAAIEAIIAGLRQLEQMGSSPSEDEEMDEYEEDPLVAHLEEMEQQLREKYDVKQTLNERLADAVATEQYELAAKLRDEFRKSHRSW